MSADRPGGSGDGLPLEGAVAFVTGAEAPLGRGLARALATAGASLGLLGHLDRGAVGELTAAGGTVVVADSDLASREEVLDAFAYLRERLAAPSIAVLTALDPLAFDHQPVEAIEDADFEAVWECGMLDTVWALQACHRHMEAGGRVVVTVPTIAMSGAPGHAALATLAEGMRLLAKSAARQWGADGLTVNCLAVAPELLDPRLAGSSPTLAAPALGRPGDPATDLGPVVAFLAGSGGHFVTGATLCLDGGAWMAP